LILNGDRFKLFDLICKLLSFGNEKTPEAGVPVAFELLFMPALPVLLSILLL